MGKLQIACARLGMLETNCYFGYDAQTGGTFIVDPADDAEAIKGWCLANGKRPAAILLTHGHFDHILAADALRREFSVPVCAAEAEKPVLENAQYNLSAMWHKPVTLKADQYLKDGQILSLAGFSIKVISTPGHTAGGLCYYLEKERVLFSGDTLFAGSYGRVDFPTSSMAEMARSVRERLLTLPEDTIVYPGHGESTDISSEKKYNPLA